MIDLIKPRSINRKVIIALTFLILAGLLYAGFIWLTQLTTNALLSVSLI